MTDNEKINYLVEMIKVKMEHFKQTRDIEFKVNIAAWTLIVIAYHPLSNLCNINTCCLIFGLFLFAFAHTSWMCLIDQSESKDLETVYNIRREIEEKSSFKYDTNITPVCEKKWLFVECGFTVILLFILGAVLYFK